MYSLTAEERKHESKDDRAASAAEQNKRARALLSLSPTVDDELNDNFRE